jgi:hypothetical protein
LVLGPYVSLVFLFPPHILDASVEHATDTSDIGFRTAVNVSGDMYAARILQKITGIRDEPSEMSSEDEEHVVGRVEENSQRV